MSSKLNRKIEKILKDCNEVCYNEDGGYDYFNSFEAANLIEQLILQEKINLLTKYWHEFIERFQTSSANSINAEIITLTQQLNKLKEV